jgi:hypothetical protein
MSSRCLWQWNGTISRESLTVSFPAGNPPRRVLLRKIVCTRASWQGPDEVCRIDANVFLPVQMGNVVLREPGMLVLWYYWVHIIAGWMFTSLWVAAFPGILKH